MKTLTKTVAMLLLASIFSSCAIFRPQPLQVVTTVPLKPVFAQLLTDFTAAKSAVNNLSSIKGKHTLTITEADAVFDNTTTNTDYTALSLLIFKGGYTYTKKKDNTVTYSLLYIQPEAAKELLSLNTNTKQALRSRQISNHTLAADSPVTDDGIKDMIVGAVEQFIDVYVNPNDGKTEKDLQVNISFSVDQNGVVEFTGPISKLTPDVSYSRDVQNTQTLTLKMVIDKGN